MSSWVKYHFEHLRRWREYALSIARATRELIPESKIYVIGGVAEERTTIYSDIDILIIIPDKIEKKNQYVKILTKAIDEYDLPIDAPVELHIIHEKEAEKYLKHQRKTIEIKP